MLGRDQLRMRLHLRHHGRVRSVRGPPRDIEQGEWIQKTIDLYAFSRSVPRKPA